MEELSERLTETLGLDDESLESEGIDCDHRDEDEMFPSLKVDINGQKHVVIRHDLIEVFSVRFIDQSNRYISGNMRIELHDGDYYLFQTNKEDSRISSIEVDSQGYAILTPDLQCPLDIAQHGRFYSHLEKFKGEVEGL